MRYLTAKAAGFTWATAIVLTLCASPSDAQAQASVAVAPALSDRSSDEPGPTEHVVTVMNRGDAPWVADVSVEAVRRVGDGGWAYDPLPGWTVEPAVVDLPAQAQLAVTVRGDAPEAIAVVVTPRRDASEQRVEVAALAWIGTEPPPDVAFPDEPDPWWQRNGQRFLTAMALVLAFALAYALGEARAHWVQRRHAQTGGRRDPRTNARGQ